jgi:DNA-binding transcriptional ArsR family regulator
MNDAHDLAEIAKLIADSTRATMLWSLMGGESRPAGELAMIAEVSNQTASNHLAQLRSAHLLTVNVRGRNHFYQLKDTSVAKALEALMHVANPGLRPVRGTVSRVAPTLVLARTCYDHLAGKLAVGIADAMRDRRWVSQKDGEFILSPRGKEQLISLGIAVEVLGASRRRYAYPCLDWSERVAHIGGFLGAAVLDWLVAEKVLVRIERTRAMRVTGAGRFLLEKTFQLRVGMNDSRVTLLRSQI